MSENGCVASLPGGNLCLVCVWCCAPADMVPLAADVFSDNTDNNEPQGGLVYADACCSSACFKAVRSRRNAPRDVTSKLGKSQL